MITKEGLNIFSYHFISFPFEFVREKKKIRFYTKLAAAADCRQSKKKLSLSRNRLKIDLEMLFFSSTINVIASDSFMHACERKRLSMKSSQ